MVDVVLVLVVLVPLVLGIMQVALVLFVRNTLTAAASEGARLATADRGPGEGAALTRAQIDAAASGRFAQDISARPTTVNGAPGVEIVVRAEVPALGLFGPAVELEVSGSAVEEAP